MDLKNFLTENKNRRILIAVGIGLIVILIGTALFIQSKKIKKHTGNTTVSPTARPLEQKTNGEIIQSLGYTIDCQLVVTTSIKKIYLEKLNRCTDALDYKISLTKKYAAYMLVDKNKTTKLFIYSLDNNVDGQLQLISQSIITYQFDSRENLYLLLGPNKLTGQQTFTYYFIPLLFNAYPVNYYKELNTFTDVDKRRVDISLPESQTPYKNVIEQQNEFILADASGAVLYTIGFNDLEKQLSPIQPAVIDRNVLKWNKRIFFYSNGSFKTMDIDGSNELTHQFICEGIEVLPIGFRDNTMARSPDGRTLAFLAPTEAQMRDNPNWKNDILAGKKVFTQGEIALYDFIKGSCQRTAVVHSILYRETFSFSPNGQYIAFVNKGVSLYSLFDHQDYQLATHNPSIEADSTAVTGPVIWDGGSRFIYTLVSKIDNGVVASTKLVRLYFDERLNGTEQNILALPNDSLVAVSADGSKVLYTKNNQIYKYDVDRSINSLFSSDSVNRIHKLVWLRDGTIVSNLWYANENLYFNSLSAMENFQIDFNGEVIVYNPIAASSSNQIFLFDLILKMQKFFKDKRTINGNILTMFY